MKVKIVNIFRNPLPEYKSEGASGMDLYAAIEAPITLGPLERKLIPTGIRVELPQGYEAQIRPRSGLAFKHGLTCLNSPGTIDADYRGEIKVILINLSSETFTINEGDRIAQIAIAPYISVEWEEIDQLNESIRGVDGFGSTGI
ncbi:MAG: dUTP diphosphatase [Flavobacteriales bacterium AspAUS03]